MGKIVTLFGPKTEPTAEDVLRDLERLLDSSPDLLHRSAEVTRRTAVPARQLLEPIRRAIRGAGS